MSGCPQQSSVSNPFLQSSLHLLIVEDVPEDAELIRTVLDDAGVHYTFVVTETIAGCRKLLQEEKWDAVLSDFHLPGATAYDVLKAIKQQQLDIPLILITETLGEEAAVECIKAGITDYVLKDRLVRLPMSLQRSLREFERRRQMVHQRTQALEREKLLSEAANRSKTEFLANMSHELRTPLTSILGFSSVLLRQVFGPLNEKQEQYLKSIHTSGEHLLDLINDLLDLSKIEADREDLQLETIQVSELCEASMEFIREQAEAQELQVSIHLASDVETCVGDRRRLRQILVNLLSNAVKFTSSGSIVLSVDQKHQHLQFAIRDTGIGIANTDIKRLFYPFQQLESGLDKRYQGTGLGLVLAQKLAHLHGGTITVTSEVGVGSCFIFTLPQLLTPLIE